MIGHYDPVNVSNLNDSLINVSLNWEVYYCYHLLFSGNIIVVQWPSQLLLLLLYFRHFRYTIKKIPWTSEKVLICVTRDFIALSWLSILVALEINVRTKPLRSWLVLPPSYLIKKSPTVILRAINPTLLSLIIHLYSYYSICDGYQVIPLAQFELWDCFRHSGPFTHCMALYSYCIVYMVDYDFYLVLPEVISAVLTFQVDSKLFFASCGKIILIEHCVTKIRCNPFPPD